MVANYIERGWPAIDRRCDGGSLYPNRVYTPDGLVVITYRTLGADDKEDAAFWDDTHVASHGAIYLPGEHNKSVRLERSRERAGCTAESVRLLVLRSFAPAPALPLLSLSESHFTSGGVEHRTALR